MPNVIELPFGPKPYQLDLTAAAPDARVAVVEAPPPPPPAAPMRDMIEAALDAPIAAPRLEDAVAPGSRVVLIVTDVTRDDPRELMARALLARLPDDIKLTIAVANGTHGQCDIERLGVPDEIWRRADTIVNHDGKNDSDLVAVGTTARGTPVRFNRCLVEADWVLATGRIKPHYFAGYGAGCKSIFPGLGATESVLKNHLLKSAPGSRVGEVLENPCRLDLEDAVSKLSARRFLLNIVLDSHGQAQHVVAGDIERAFREGAQLCGRFFKVDAPRADVVIVSDELPVSASLYQASKTVAAAARLLPEGGTMIIAAACQNGAGPTHAVNHEIYELGLTPRLPKKHRLILVSDLARDEVETSYCEYAPSIKAALGMVAPQPKSITVLPRAASLIITPTDGASAGVGTGAGAGAEG